MWNRDATWGDLRKLHEDMKGKDYTSSLDWIGNGTVEDTGQPDSAPLFPSVTKPETKDQNNA